MHLRPDLLTARVWLVAVAAVLVACPGRPTPGDDTSDDPSSSTSPATDPPASTDPPEPTTTEPPDDPTTDGPDSDSESSPDPTDPPGCQDPAGVCDEPVTDCERDRDRDGVPFTCDNAVDHFNPDQTDIDGDGFGDVFDQCPTVPSDSNSGDSDRDGVGNACDACARQPNFYNKDVAGVPAFMLVRGVPAQTDADRDGIGDACDNCVRTPNCQQFGDGDGLTPHVVGTPVDDEAADCQVDADDDLVGDACAGTQLPGAAGPVGLGLADDFDQDGLANQDDACPRQPVAAQPCEADAQCQPAAKCTGGVCNHVDQDNDGVGDICDTCPHAPNGVQVLDGGQQEDDPDGDFVGNACEGHPECFERANARPFAFFDRSFGGLCCVAIYEGRPLIDPEGDPVDPGSLGLPPGALELPPGCDGPGQRVRACDVSLEELWASLCFLPQSDEDVDSVPDTCDLCPHAIDPNQETFVDEQGMEFPNFGKFCNGEFSPDNLDPANMCLP